MEKAYAVLGVRDSASAPEVEEAYRGKKRLYDLSRFVEGSLDWQFARARNEALDEAYRYAITASRSAVSSSRPEYYDLDVSDWHPFGEILRLAVVCPILIYAMQLAAPTVLYEMMPEWLRGAVWLLDVAVLFAGCFFPLAARFVFFRRPVRSLAAMLLIFPFTLLFADLCTSLLLRFSMSPISRAPYVPFFYFAGPGPLFILLHAHCTILGMAKIPKRSAPVFRRLMAHTLTLVISAALSVALCAELNRESAPVSEAARHGPGEESWQALNLKDAGVVEIPGGWYVEDSNGKLTRTQHEGSVQYVREALTAHTRGRVESGLDYSFEFLVYWWTNLSGRALPPPGGIVDRIQEHQLGFLRREFPEIAFHARDVIELEGRPFSVLTVEANLLPEFAVRFRNAVLERDNKVYTFTISYPAYEEGVWSETLEQVLSRWSL